MEFSYHCHEVDATGEALGPTVELRGGAGKPLEMAAWIAADTFLKDAAFGQSVTTHVRVEPTDGREPATFEVAGRWERNFRAEAKLVPSSVPS